MEPRKASLSFLTVLRAAHCSVFTLGQFVANFLAVKRPKMILVLLKAIDTAS